jgi:hypothetical protein
MKAALQIEAHHIGGQRIHIEGPGPDLFTARHSAPQSIAEQVRPEPAAVPGAIHGQAREQHDGNGGDGGIRDGAVAGGGRSAAHGGRSAAHGGRLSSACNAAGARRRLDERHEERPLDAA